MVTDRAVTIFKNEIVSNSSSMSKEEVLNELSSADFIAVSRKNVVSEGTIVFSESVVDIKEFFGGVPKEAIIDALRGNEVFLNSKSNKVMTDDEIKQEKHNLLFTIATSPYIPEVYCSDLNGHYSIEVIHKTIKIDYGSLDKYLSDLEEDVGEYWK